MKAEPEVRCVVICKFDAHRVEPARYGGAIMLDVWQQATKRPEASRNQIEKRGERFRNTAWIRFATLYRLSDLEDPSY